MEGSTPDCDTVGAAEAPAKPTVGPKDRLNVPDGSSVSGEAWCGDVDIELIACCCCCCCCANKAEASENPDAAAKLVADDILFDCVDSAIDVRGETDSDPACEQRECEAKAGALIAAAREAVRVAGEPDFGQ